MSMRENEFEDRPELVKARARTLFVRNLLFVLTSMTLIAVLGVLVFDSLNGFQTRRTLVDCVTPGGRCFTESQARTGEAVQQLIDANQLDEVATRRVVVIAAACAQEEGNDTVREVQRCVDLVLKNDTDESKEGGS